MRRAMFSLFRAIGLLSIVTFAVTMVSAQFGSGIQGVVTDGSGSAVPGATVDLTNTGTNASQQTTTNDSGLYQFSNLSQGTYQIVVTQSGFKKKIVTSALVGAESTVRFDIALEVGEVSAEVTVDGSDTAPLQTESANVSRNITTREITELPQVGRDPYQLVRLAPGVFGDGARAAGGGSARLGNSSQSGPGASSNGIFAVENQVQVTANGQRVTSNNFEIDGVSVNSQTWGGAAVITPSQESISEVQVTSSTYSAEDGRNSGAQVKVITKYGTNRWSGSGFFKINDPSLNAYNKFRGIAPLFGTFTSVPPIRVEDELKTYGGSFGGPIVRDKLFFFFAYEGTRSNGNNVAQNAVWVDTQAFRDSLASLRAGTLSAAMIGSGAAPRIASILTPDCSRLTGGPYTTLATCRVVGNGVDIGSITGAYGTYVPNASNTLGGGFDGVADLQLVYLNNLTSFTGDQYTFRADYQLTNSDKLTFTSNFTPLTTSSSNAAAQARPQADLVSDRLTYLIGGIYSKAISSTMLNEFRFNYTKWKFNEIDSNPDTDWGLPRIEIEQIWNGERLRYGAPRGETTPGFFDQETMDFRNVFTNILGSHALKIGGGYRREINTSGAPGGARSLFSFVRMWNFANGAPIVQNFNADADGKPKANDVPFNAANIGLFVQDDWKFRPNLTLNLGLRWEFFAPITAGGDGEFGRLIVGNNLIDARIERVKQFTDPDYNNFAPQLGFAWSPSWFDQKLVIRGGGGMGYDRLASALFSNVRFAPPNATRYSICCADSTRPFNVGNPNNSGVIQFTGSTDGTIYGYPQNSSVGGGFGPNGGPNRGQVEIYGSPAELPTAYVYRYSMEAQYELPLKMVGTLGYQGSKGSRFVRILPLHQFYAGTTAPTFRTVYFASPDVNTSYNALNAGLRKRFTDDFDINANYKFSKSLDTVSVESPCACTNQTYSWDNGTEKGPSDFDVTHYFNASGTWEPSWFKGQKNIAGDLLSGWSFSPIVTWRGGFPWTPIVGATIRNTSDTTGIGTIRPVGYSGEQPRSNSNENFINGGLFPGVGTTATVPGTCLRRNNYFVTSTFPLATNAQCNNPGFATYELNPPAVGRNVFRGPRYFNVDLSVAKRISLAGNGFFGEAARLDLRFNFFNLFNTLNFASFNAFSDSTRVDNARFGMPTAAYAGRVGEFQARFSF